MEIQNKCFTNIPMEIIEQILQYCYLPDMMNFILSCKNYSDNIDINKLIYNISIINKNYVQFYSTNIEKQLYHNTQFIHKLKINDYLNNDLLYYKYYRGYHPENESVNISFTINDDEHVILLLIKLDSTHTDKIFATDYDPNYNSDYDSAIILTIDRNYTYTLYEFESEVTYQEIYSPDFYDITRDDYGVKNLKYKTQYLELNDIEITYNGDITQALMQNILLKFPFSATRRRLQPKLKFLTQ